jgi:hypothetical protein
MHKNKNSYNYRNSELNGLAKLKVNPRKVCFFNIKLLTVAHLVDEPNFEILLALEAKECQFA